VSRTLINVHKRLMRGEIPTPYIMVQTHMGYRAFSNRELSGVFDFLGVLADGTYTAEGDYYAGALSWGAIEKSARVVDFGSFERTISPAKDDVLTALGNKQLQHISVEMDNVDRYFSKLIAKEPFIGRPIYVFIGFQNEPIHSHFSIFRGTITELSVLDTMTIEADEK